MYRKRLPASSSYPTPTTSAMQYVQVICAAGKGGQRRRAQKQVIYISIYIYIYIYTYIYIYIRTACYIIPGSAECSCRLGLGGSARMAAHKPTKRGSLSARARGREDEGTWGRPMPAQYSTLFRSCVKNKKLKIGIVWPSNSNCARAQLPVSAARGARKGCL
jgi:hypothetical protein